MEWGNRRDGERMRGREGEKKRHGEREGVGRMRGKEMEKWRRNEE